MKLKMFLFSKLMDYNKHHYISALYNKQTMEDEESCHMAILNADGVYVAVIAMLSLCLKLATCGWYNKHGTTTSPPVSEVCGCF